MKSENVLLAICLVMILLVLFGLTVLSCRSSKLDQSTQLEINTVTLNEEEKKILADSAFMESLKAKFKLEWVQEKYTPVKDSTGNIVGSVLAERYSATSSSEESRDVLINVWKEEESAAKSSVSEEMKLAEDIKKESKPDFPVKSTIAFFVIVLIIVFFVTRKFKPSC